MLTPPTPAWRATVRFMRIACPLNMVAALALGTWAWSSGNYWAMAVNFFCAGISAVLTDIEWRWFKL